MAYLDHGTPQRINITRFRKLAFIYLIPVIINREPAEILDVYELRCDPAGELLYPVRRSDGGE